MILIKGNVERMAETDAQAKRLQEEGYEFISGEDYKGNSGKKGLSGMKVDELKILAKENGIEGYDSLTKPELLKVLKDVV